MNVIHWAGLFAIFAGAFFPITIVYTRAYGNREGWSWILDSLADKSVKNKLGIPPLVILLYFVLIQTLSGTAAFLTMKILSEEITTMIPLDPASERILDVTLGVFFAEIALLWIWLKSFFNSPPAAFWTLISGTMLFVAWTVSLPYYYDLNKEPHGRPARTTSTPFLFAMLYYVIGTVSLLILSFYLFSNSKTKLAAGEQDRQYGKNALEETNVDWFYPTPPVNRS